MQVIEALIDETDGGISREDPQVAERIVAALGRARTVVNAGAGRGAYEPRDRHVIAVEPSDRAAARRPRDLPPAIRAAAGALPLRDGSVGAAMAVLSLQHWDPEQERGVRELRRVARDAVVILTCDPRVCTRTWLAADYLPELAELERQIFPPIKRIAGWLGGDTRIDTVMVPRDPPDWSFGTFWAQPERLLAPEVRAAIPSLAQLPEAVIRRALAAVVRDLNTGNWDRRHGHLRELGHGDVGLRLLVNRPDPVGGSS